MTAALSDPALDEILVVDLSRALAGPHAGQMLGDLGARVIKVERPDHGDDARQWGPPFVMGRDGAAHSTYFLSCNRNKESVSLDLHDAADREIASGLIRQADVLIENFRPGVMDRLGYSSRDLAALNPRLIQLSISGFGHDGPERERAGYDQIVQGEAGLMTLTGSSPDDPQRVGVPIVDLLAGLHGVIGVLAALHRRARTGRGGVVRTSLLSSAVGVHSFQGTRASVAGETPRAQGNQHPSIAPYGLFRCRDGSVQIAVGNDVLWSALCTEFDLDAGAACLATNADRVRERDLVTASIERAFSSLDVTTALARLHRVGIPAGRIRSIPEVYEWVQVAAPALLVGVEHAALGHVRLPGPPIRFFDVDPAGERETSRKTHLPPPTLNQHGDDVRAWIESIAG